jgi:hypothetical protein
VCTFPKKENNFLLVRRKLASRFISGTSMTQWVSEFLSLQHVELLWIII